MIRGSLSVRRSSSCLRTGDPCAPRSLRREVEWLAQVTTQSLEQLLCATAASVGRAIDKTFNNPPSPVALLEFTTEITYLAQYQPVDSTDILLNIAYLDPREKLLYELGDQYGVRFRLFFRPVPREVLVPPS
jgi:hypothetical protein